MRNFLIAIGLLISFVAFWATANVLINKASDYKEEASTELNQPIISQTYVSSEPNGPEIKQVHPGQTIYVVSHRKRETACYIDVSWYWTKDMGDGSRVIKHGEQGSLYSDAGAKVISYSSIVPLDLEPGNYLFSRVVAYNCGDGLTTHGHYEVPITVSSEPVM